MDVLRKAEQAVDTEQADVSTITAPLRLLSNRDAFAIGVTDSLHRMNLSTLLSCFDGASEMRFGNTQAEMQFSEWEPYVSRRLWYLPSYEYPVLNVVYAQFRGPGLEPLTVKLPVYQCRDGLGGTLFPVTEISDCRFSDVILEHNFESWCEHWVSYKKTHGRGNTFFPMTHRLSGGANNSGYVWSDSSRWAIDAPEQPNSILVALCYYKDLFPAKMRARSGVGNAVDLRNVQLEVFLRGRELGLGSAHVTFWVLLSGSRWHLKTNHLVISNKEWIKNKFCLEENQENWECSWARDGEPESFSLSRVKGYGFAFRGFPQGENVNGAFEMCSFKLSRITKCLT